MTEDTERLLMELFQYDAVTLLTKLLKEKEDELKRVINIAKEFMADEDHKEFEEEIKNEK